MPNSIPLVTATPLADTVILLHGRESGATEQSPLAAVAYSAQRRMQSMETANEAAMMARSYAEQNTVSDEHLKGDSETLPVQHRTLSSGKEGAPGASPDPYLEMCKH